MQTVKEVVQQAAQWEDAAYRFYVMCAGLAEAESIHVLFRKLAAEELKHKNLLLRGGLGSGSLHLSISWFDLIDALKTYNFEQVRRITQVLKFAMEKERSAQERYVRISESVDDPAVKRLCNSLALMESGHYNLLRAEYERLVSKPK